MNEKMERAKNIAIASDHAGFENKQHIIGLLKELKYECKDFGTYSKESSDYPDFIHPLARAMEKMEFSKGIVLCGSGNGVNMTVNKYQGIRSALCWNKEIAELARKHNDANVCALPARFVTKEEALEIVKVFLITDFEGGRHQKRIDKIPIK
jgi:ribose 5-phosphate isomerase B